MATPTASGGFVIRSERAPALELRTSTGQLGPGQYSLETPKLIVPAAVPFHTGREKVLNEATTYAAFSPGVGSYDTAHAIDFATSLHIQPTGPTANFNKDVGRFSVDKSSNVTVPGPGAYPEGNDWIKKSFQYKAPPPKQRIGFSRVPSAPSIPTIQQSYGYEEGNGGALVMQKPPEPIRTGEGRDKVGPTDYNPSKLALPLKAVAWGRDKRLGQKYTTDSPGPGTYNPALAPPRSHSSPIVVVVNGMEVQFGGTNGTAQFASKVPLSSQRKPKDQEMTPGPGAYVEGAGLAAKAAPLPTDLQFFGSAAKRHCQIDPMKSLSAPTWFRTPGPGSYQDPNKNFALTRSLADPLPFSSTTSRFGESGNGIPGPGDYKPDYVVNMSKAQADKAAISKGGIFGTGARRFSGREEQDAKEVPGPGNYSPPVQLPQPKHRGDTSVFESKTSRFRSHTAPPTSIEPKISRPETEILGNREPRGDPANLGPGSYVVKDLWAPKNSRALRNPGFGSDSIKVKPIAQSFNTPGPGRYRQGVTVDEVYRPYSKPPKETVFGSQQQRFKPAGSFTPGPGTYVGQGELAKKSYNITYSGVQVTSVGA